MKYEIKCLSNHTGTCTANISTCNTARYTTSHHVQVLLTMFCFLLLLLIKVSIKQVAASAHAQLFPLVINVGNTLPPLITLGKNNCSSFFQKKRDTCEMSSMGHRTNL